ncbi:MAG TPA: hypothetical protein VFZ66_27745 [Herpetosiphonaceae bacterium]
MTLYACDQMPVREYRPSVSVSLISTTDCRRSLICRLAEGGIGCHVLLLQCDHEDAPPPPGTRVLPPIQGPLLLDTRGLRPVMQITVLHELTTRYPHVPTLILTRPTDWLLHRLAASCPAVYAVASDHVSPGELGLWLQHCGIVGPARAPHVRPAYVGVAAPSFTVVDPRFLAILVALAQAPSIELAAASSPLPGRTFYRKLRQLRMTVNVPARMYRGRASALLQSLLDALAAPAAHG